ncbi:SusC/RagA family TonB-linked outer membrane protein [Flagellimonas algicola]|uniref:TonB-dependent receptor n=1 Tax=Flagellimonas algicola TaxID=2583815 RepID=A0ABY2WPZ3_9FLAO|nr:TonB-dependent receptor [Allomuricauda algicola]TMU56741.1 TonB-dependent receptor [Allomuricauda algicola]
MMKKLNVLLLFLFMGTATISWAQQAVSGVVYDDQNVPLPGANILEKGTSNGVVTDFDGNFTISVQNGNAVLVVSYIGFDSKEIQLDGSPNYSIQLVASTTGLDEVVVIGYGTTTKKDLTGSVVSLGSKDVVEQRKTDVAQAIQGRLAGVDVRTLNNKPGAPLSINVRGNTALRNDNTGNDGINDDPGRDLGQPLYVVDGIFFDNINALNPADIQQIDVLKDASSTAIYGSRGANGVVIITTKNGFEGKARFTYDATFGVRSPVNVPDFYDGDEYVAFVNDVVRAREFGTLFPGTPTVADYDAINPDLTTEFIGDEELNNVAQRNYTDWIDLAQETGIQTSHTFGVTGGENGLIYNASIGYLKDEGVVGIEDYERYNLTGALTKKMNDKFSFGIKTYLSFSEREQGSRELFRSSFRLAPTVNPFEDDGSIDLIPDEQDQRFINPIYEIDGAWRVNTKRFDVIANVFLEYKPYPWMNIKTQFSPNLSSTRDGEYRGLLTKAARNDPGRTRSIYNTFTEVAYTWDNIVDMEFNLMDGHDLKATLISSLYQREREGSNIQTRNFSTDDFLFFNTGEGLDVREFDSNFLKENIASFAGRLNYSIKDRYLFTVTGRYDGASRLAQGNQWDFFPSAAFAWRISEENFVQDADWLDNLKLRLSYGRTGNIEPVNPYSSFSFLDGSTYLFGDQVVNAQTVSGLANQELTWEISKETNIGIDLGLFNNRIGLSVDYYNKETDGSLFPRTLFDISGFDSAIGNFGSIRNRGIEVVLNTLNISKGDFTWRSEFNFARNKNEILELDGDLEQIPFGRHGVLQVGQPSDAIFAYENEGIWQLDEVAEAESFGYLPGQFKFVDQNNDGVINNDDKTVIGSNAPDWIGGMTNTFRYRNLEARVQVNTRQGTLGHSEWYQNFAPYQNDGAKFNKLNLDYWTPNNPNASRPALAYGHPGEYYYEEFDFVKIGNIGFTYSFEQPVLDKLKLNGLNVSLDIQNPFIFTDYEGPDPETGLQNSYSSAYLTKVILLGLNVTL